MQKRSVQTVRDRTSGCGALCIWQESALCAIMDETDRLQEAGGQGETSQALPLSRQSRK
ncbi:MAG: hypothetical protein V8R14_03325 [Clostridia bacterium]